MLSEKSAPDKKSPPAKQSSAGSSLWQHIGKSFYDSIGDIVFGMEDGTVSIFGLVFGVASSTTSSSVVLLAGATGAISAAASINVYQTDGNTDGDTWTQVNDELQQIIDANTNNASAGSVVSISLGIDESDITSDDVRALNSSLQQLTQVDHMTVFVASGDCAAFADESFGSLSVRV